MGLDKTGDFYLVDLFGGGSRGEAEDFLWPCEWRGLGWLGLGVYRASQLKRFAAAEAQAHCLLLPLTPFSVGSNPSPSPVRHITPDLVPQRLCGLCSCRNNRTQFPCHRVREHLRPYSEKELMENEEKRAN